MRHIGIVVEDFERAIGRFKGFGLHCSEVIERKETGMKYGFFPIGDTLIEFLWFVLTYGDDYLGMIQPSLISSFVQGV